ncbi:MAG: ABC transporter permease [Candidatus Hodarchaeales archaeon]
MKLKDYVIRRLILLIPVLFGVSLVTFILSDSVGDPVAAYVGRSIDKLPPERVEQLRKQLGLDKPILERFRIYLTRLLAGDWGKSPTLQNQPVLDIIANRFPASAELAVYSMILAITIGIPLGIISATKKDKLPDQLSRMTALSGVSMPIFWLGLLVQIILFNYNAFVTANNLPFLTIPFHERLTLNRYSPPNEIIFGKVSATGFLLIDSLLYRDLMVIWLTALAIFMVIYYFVRKLRDKGKIGHKETKIFALIGGLVFLTTLIYLSYIRETALFIDVVIHIFAPSFCLAWVQMAIITRMTRMAMLETMKKDFILLAKSKGLSQRVIIYRHALRNAIIPTLTVAGLALAGLMTGAVLTETVFDWPGLGWWAVQSVAVLDTAAIQGFVIVTAIIYVLSNLIVDILYAVVDPRIRFD